MAFKQDHQKSWSKITKDHENASFNMVIFGDLSQSIMIPKFQLREEDFYCVFQKKALRVHDSFCCWREVVGNPYNSNLYGPSFLY